MADPDVNDPQAAQGRGAGGAVPLIGYRATAAADRSVARRHALKVRWNVVRAILNWNGIALVVGAGIVLMPAFEGYVIAGVLLLLAAVNFEFMRGRARRAATVVQRLAMATELGQPLPGALEAAAGEERGAARCALRSLAALVGEGMPIDAALGVAAPWVGYRVIDAVSAGLQDGTLEVTLKRLAAEAAEVGLHGSTRLSMAYPMYLLLLLAIAGLFEGAVPVQMLKDLWRSYQGPLPKHGMPAGLWIDWTDIGMVAAAVLVVMVGWSSAPGLRGRLVNGTRRVWGRVAWRLPVVHGVLLSRGLGDVMCSVSDAVEAGRPLVEATALRGGRHLNVVLEERVRMWQAGMAAGIDPAEAARRAGLPTLVSGLLGPAMRSGSMRQTLGFLAVYYQARLARAAVLVRESADCVCVLIGAGIVWVVAQTVLLPVWAMVDALSAQVWR